MTSLFPTVTSFIEKINTYAKAKLNDLSVTGDAPSTARIASIGLIKRFIRAIELYAGEVSITLLGKSVR
jgi:hypothetical protein